MFSGVYGNKANKKARKTGKAEAVEPQGIALHTHSPISIPEVSLSEHGSSLPMAVISRFSGLASQ